MERYLDSELFVSHMLEFQTHLLLEEDDGTIKAARTALGSAPEFTTEQLEWINDYMIYMTDAFGVATLHSMGLSVADAQDKLETFETQLKDDDRAKHNARLERLLDSAYNEFRDEQRQHKA